MIYSLLGKLIVKNSQFAVIEANGIGFKIFISIKVFQQLPKIGSRLKLFCYSHIRQDGFELYGFLTEEELKIFELLNSISNIGPKIALKLLGSLKIGALSAAIDDGRTELLMKTSGIGKKTAERIILELRGKIKSEKNEEIIALMEADDDIEAALKKMGYKQGEIKSALKNISPKIKKIEERLKAALKILLLSTFFIFFSVNSVLAAAPQELKDSISKKAEDLKKINEQIQEVQKNLEETKEEQKTLKKEINKVGSQLNQLELGIKSSEIYIEKLVLETESLEYDVSDLGEQIKDKKDAVAEALRELQEKDEETPLRIFLKNKSLSESVFEVQSLADIGSNLSEQIGEMRDFKIKLEEKLGEVADKKQSKEIESVNLKNKKVIIAEIKNNKQSFLEITKNQEKNYQKNLNELEKIREEIADEIDKLEEELRLKIDPSALPGFRPGVLAVPVSIPPARANFSHGQKHGFTRNNGKRYHNGLDFGAPIGTPIFSAESGKVIAVGDQDNYKTNGKKLCWRGAYGKFVLIKHENNLTTLYAHLSLWNVKVGDSVKRGEVIGYIGNTGRSTGPHLHFTVYSSQTIPPATDGFYEGTRSSRICGPLPVGGDLDPEKYLAL